MISYPYPHIDLVKLRSSFLVVAIILWNGFASGLMGQSSPSGDIHGHVFSASSGQYLNNARVTIPGTEIVVFTNTEGVYQITGIKPGKVSVLVTSTGMSTKSAEVEVKAGETAVENFTLRLESSVARSDDDAIVLDPYSVEDRIMSAQVLALNEQRYAPNIKNVVSVDEFGDIGEGNIAEFVKFIPGVSIDYSANVGVGISVRGFPASNTLVSLDGNDLASAANTSLALPTRTVELGALRQNNISRIEVTKSPTPDLPANSLGGSVNIISKSGFDRREALFTSKAFVTFNSRSFGSTKLSKRAGSRPDLDAGPVQPGFRFSYEKPVNKSIAFNISGGSARRNYQYRTAFTPWNFNTNVLSGVRIEAQEQLYNATDVAIGFDWRSGAGSSLKANFLYVDSTSYISQNRLNTEIGGNATGDANSFHSPSANGLAEMGNPNTAQQNGKTLQLNLGYNYKWNDWDLQINGFTSLSRLLVRDVGQGFFNRVDLTIDDLAINGEGLYAGMPNAALPRTITAFDSGGNAVDIFNGNLYSISRAISRPSNNNNHKAGAKISLKKEFSDQLTVKIGASYDRQIEDDFTLFSRWDFLKGSAARVGNYDLLIPEYSKDAQNYFPGHQVQWVSLSKIYRLYQEHPDYFTFNAANSHAGNVRPSKRLIEAITAGYVRFDVNLANNRLWLVGGVRYEETADEGWGPLDDPAAQYQKDASGNLLRDSNGNLIRITNDALGRQQLRWTYRGAHAKKNYHNFYPSFNATWHITDELLVRAAYAKTIGRPNLDEIIPGITIADPSAPPANRIISVINSGLKPWTSNGYDLSLESYNATWGVGSIGVFQKNIKDFFGGFEGPATSALLAQLNIPEDYPGEYSDYIVRTKENVGDAKIRGFEVSYKQSLGFLGKWGRQMQVFGNGTFLDLSGSNQADFSGYSPRIYNWGINFASPKLFVRLNWNDTPSHLLQPKGDDPTIPVSWSSGRAVVSADVEYRLTNKFSLYLTAENLTDVPDVNYRYGSGTPDYAKNQGISVYGTDFTLGIKGRF